MKTFKVLSIDAWIDNVSCSECGEGIDDGVEVCECGCKDLDYSWSWNNWFLQDEKYKESSYGPLTEKSALEFFKDFYIKSGHEDKFRIDDDQYNLVLVKCENNMPLYAIEYGSEG